MSRSHRPKLPSMLLVADGHGQNWCTCELPDSTWMTSHYDFFPRELRLALQE
jgi:hypothetical protein